MNVSPSDVIAPIIVASDPRLAALERFKALTPREREVALRVARGQRQHAMAREMGLSTKTIQSHRERALLALGVKSNAEVAILAYVAGFVSAP